jgi:N-acetylglucosamine malate deacetylase 2
MDVHVVIVAAHPDDETIGASALLASRAEVTVIHVTDGVPNDPRWWPRGVFDRASYARERDREARRALSILRANRISLGFVDQETMFCLGDLVEALSDVLFEGRPDLVVSHAYEGGHPDHDTVACAVALATPRAAPAAARFEMALYHGAGGGLRAGELIGTAGQRRVLSSEERARKTAMLRQYRSQHETLAPFADLAHECYRRAPEYDFGLPPHGGPLLYEIWGMAAGSEWRARSAPFARRTVFTMPALPEAASP